MELEVGKTYLVNPDSWEEGWKEATYKFLGINNDSALVLDPDFDYETFDAYWFEHSQTGNVAAWYLYKDAEMSKFFLRSV